MDTKSTNKPLMSCIDVWMPSYGRNPAFQVVPTGFKQQSLPLGSTQGSIAHTISALPVSQMKPHLMAKILGIGAMRSSRGFHEAARKGDFSI